MNTILHALQRQASERRAEARKFAADAEPPSAFGDLVLVVKPWNRPTVHEIAKLRVEAARVALDQAFSACSALPRDDAYELDAAVSNLHECIWRVQDAGAQLERWFNPEGNAR